HGEHDDASYVPAKMKKEPWAQDCVARTEQLILENNWADSETLKKWRSEISAEVEKAVETAQREAAPVGSEEDWCAVAARGAGGRIFWGSLTSQPTRERRRLFFA